MRAQRIGSRHVRNGVFYGLVGAAFAVLGLVQYRFLDLQALFFILIGVFLLHAAAANFLESRQFH